MRHNTDRLLRSLARSRELEAVALTRLRRAQTLFEKHYVNTQRIQDAIARLQSEADTIASRLLGE